MRIANTHNNILVLLNYFVYITSKPFQEDGITCDELDQNLLTKENKLSNECIDLIRKKMEHLKRNLEDKYLTKGRKIDISNFILGKVNIFSINFTCYLIRYLVPICLLFLSCSFNEKLENSFHYSCLLFLLSMYLFCFVLIGFISNFMKVCHLTHRLIVHGFGVENSVNIALSEFVDEAPVDQLMDEIVSKLQNTTVDICRNVLFPF